VGGCCLGFLVFNRHPAKIFMGDAGSLFLGYLLAVIALKLRFVVAHPSGVVALGLLTGPALFDTTLVVISRLRAGTSILVGGTDHTSHRLLRLGLSMNGTLGVLAAGAVISTTAGVAVGRGALPATAVLPSALVGGASAMFLMLRVPVAADASRSSPVPHEDSTRVSVAAAEA